MGSGNEDSEYWVAVDHQVGKPGETVPCNDTYHMNFGVRPHDLDLQTLEPDHLRDEVLELSQGQLTVLISCPPCTGYSQKRYRNSSEDDTRNALVARTADFVAAFRPEFLVMENVPEMLTGNFAHHWFRLLRALYDMHYTVWADILDFARLGLPQHRRRALVIARRGSRPVPNLSTRMAPPERRISVQAALERYALPIIRQGEADPTDPIHACPRIGERASRVSARCQLIRDHGNGRWSGLNLEDLTESQAAVLTPRIREALQSGDRKTYPDCYGTIRPDEPAPTLIRQCGDIGTGPWYHWQENRMLSGREMAILQGFPYERTTEGEPFYRFSGPLSKVYQQIGNAVPPLVSWSVADEIVAALNGRVGLIQREIPPKPWLKLPSSSENQPRGFSNGR